MGLELTTIGFAVLRLPSNACFRNNVKASFTLSRYTPGASRQFVAGGPGQTGTNREGIRARSYLTGNATDQIRFGAKTDHGLSLSCYGLRRCIPGVAPEALRCIPMRPDTPRLCPGHRRQILGVTTASHESRAAQHQCYTVTYEYQ